MQKLLRITTADISLNGLLKGQLRFLSDHFEVVGVASDTGVLQKVGEREGVRVVNVPMKREISIKNDIKSLWALYRLFRREKPDIIHSNTPKGSLLSMVAGKLARVPQRIYTVTGLRYQGAEGRTRKILQLTERIACRCATTVIPEGEGVKQALIADHITTKPLSVVLNGNLNGVDTEHFAPDALDRSRDDIRRELGFAADDFVFIFIGRIVRDKGMNELADAMRRLRQSAPQCKLLLVGSWEQSLDPITDENKRFFETDAAVRYVGSQSDVRPFLRAADALAFPSYREGFPNVVLEAQSMGLAAVVTDINGCNEIVRPPLNGLIIPPRDADALYEAMKKMAENPDETAEMGRQARPLIIERFERKKVWQALLARYKSLQVKGEK